MDRRQEYHQHLIRLLLSGEIGNKDELQRRKVKFSGEYGLGEVPKNSETLALVPPENLAQVRDILRRKPVRTLSGVAVVAVMTSPAPCPHGKCTYCPGGVDNNSPQSYTGKEPAARRAADNEFDPYRQVRSRIGQLEAIGHHTDKVDLIIMGGTFTSRPAEYQEWFVHRCFEAFNDRESASLEEAHQLNEGAERRVIGMTVETRPDALTLDVARECMRLGTTRVELGVQILDDDILRAVNRGHGVKEVAEATRTARDLGLKVCYHIMPGLPGSSPEKDVASFRQMFDDPRFRPDMIKIYPTLVVKGTKLYESWLRGEYEPYDTAKAVEVIAEMKKLVPEYVRIQRIQRDIPVPLIEAGVDKGHLRELVQERLRSQGQRCQCIRCREVGLLGISEHSPDDLIPRTVGYEASGGREEFISLVLENNALVGYARLRMPPGDTAIIRELKVFGRMARIGDGEGEWQHRGIGHRLLGMAEGSAAQAGYDSVKVTSGVGARGYYASLGYERALPHMRKWLGGK
ncbi:MAG: tRNA uridine(34) 5-carboxymethylaminomethyl modification radical SAM/GNAT enzyme Elp3 [Methanomassiliicoccales archaeon]|nr:tRNA uridine(34) 5-carboxymethylaminomethyl modification radical SAM/GNAT enzyme Elp3 [Methanomassiliicoccales archaeon]